MKPLASPDRYLDCEFALEPAFQKMIAESESKGWTADEVAYALLGLARAHLLTLACNEQVDDHIKRMQERVAVSKAKRHN